MIISRSVLPEIKSGSGKTLYGKLKHTLYVQRLFFFFFRKACRLEHIPEKLRRAGQATDGNIEHAHCMMNA